MTEKNDKKEPETKEPMSFAEGIGRMLAMMMLLLRALVSVLFVISSTDSLSLCCTD